MTTVLESQDRTAEVLVERRNTRRTRSFKGAVLRFNNGYSALSAVVKNLSEGGAMLVMGDTTGVPSDAVMEINGEGRPRPVHLIWREPERLGVRFDG